MSSMRISNASGCSLPRSRRLQAPYERFGRTLVNIPACHKTALRFRGRTTQQIIRSQKRIRQRRGRGALEKRLRYRVRWRLKRSLVKSAAVLLALSVASSAAEMQRRSAEDRRALKSGCGDPPRSKLRMRRKKRLGTSPYLPEISSAAYSCASMYAPRNRRTRRCFSACCRRACLLMLEFECVMIPACRLFP